MITELTTEKEIKIAISAFRNAEPPLSAARGHFEKRIRSWERQFDVSFGDNGIWRYVSTRPETGARRDASILADPETGEWRLRINRYVGEGLQLICDDAAWHHGLELGIGCGLSYEDAVNHAVGWLANDCWDERLRV